MSHKKGRQSAALSGSKGHMALYLWAYAVWITNEEIDNGLPREGMGQTMGAETAAVPREMKNYTKGQDEA